MLMLCIIVVITMFPFSWILVYVSSLDCLYGILFIYLELVVLPLGYFDLLHDYDAIKLSIVIIDWYKK